MATTTINCRVTDAQFISRTGSTAGSQQYTIFSALQNRYISFLDNGIINNSTLLQSAGAYVFSYLLTITYDEATGVISSISRVAQTDNAGYSAEPVTTTITPSDGSGAVLRTWKLVKYELKNDGYGLFVISASGDSLIREMTYAVGVMSSVIMAAIFHASVPSITQTPILTFNLQNMSCVRTYTFTYVA